MDLIYSDDGRILTPLKSLKPILKGAYPSFLVNLAYSFFLYCG